MRAAPFTLAAWTRNGAPGAPLVVFVEGDGLAWLDRRTVSSDPTPRDPLALRLAARDPAANVAYVARPCQFLRDAAACQPRYWTSHRFAPEVVAATDAAISALKGAAAADGLHLVGYSGGGAIAALVAAGRDDVLSLRTVAGNLDHAAVNRLHGVDPLNGSLDARDVAARLKVLPQIHFVGGADRVVPPAIADGYLAAAGPGACARVVRVAEAGHNAGWAERWPELSALPLPSCP